jgi:hypothetical protein
MIPEVLRGNLLYVLVWNETQAFTTRGRRPTACAIAWPVLLKSFLGDVSSIPVGIALYFLCSLLYEEHLKDWSVYGG